MWGWPDANQVLDVANYFFGCLFIVEVTLKIFVMLREFFLDVWNVLDLFIVGLFLGENLVEQVWPINAGMARLLRLTRLVRLVRLVKTLEGFDACFILSTALQSSAAILFWAGLLLVWSQLVLALLTGQILHATYFRDETQSMASQREVYEYFGTFSRSFLSMFEITLANWPPVCRLLSENVSEWFVPFFLAHKLVIGFAVVSIINGVFMQETFKVAGADDNIMVRRKREAMKAHGLKMKALFELLDQNIDGTVDFDEFQVIADSDIAKTWLAAMDVEVDDFLAAVKEILNFSRKLSELGSRLDFGVQGLGADFALPPVLRRS